MEERQWEQIGAAAGVVFVVLLVGGSLMIPSYPHVDAPTAKIVSWVTGHRRAILAGASLQAIAVVAFLWFVGHLRHVLDRAEGGAEALSPIVLVSGSTLAAVGMISTMPVALLAFMAGGPGGLTDATIVRVTYDLNSVLGGMATVLFAPFLLAMGYAMVRRELVASWLGWLALAFAAVDIVGGIAMMTLATYATGWAALGFVAFLGSSLVILLASVSMLWRPEATRAVSHTPIFAH